MNFLQATTSKKNKAWVDSDLIRIVWDTNDDQNIIGATVTKKDTEQSRKFLPVGKGEDSLVKMFQNMEHYIGKLNVDTHARNTKRSGKKLQAKRRAVVTRGKSRR